MLALSLPSTGVAEIASLPSLPSLLRPGGGGRAGSFGSSLLRRLGDLGGCNGEVGSVGVRECPSLALAADLSCPSVFGCPPMASSALSALQSMAPPASTSPGRGPSLSAHSSLSSLMFLPVHEMGDNPAFLLASDVSVPGDCSPLSSPPSPGTFELILS